MTINFNAEPYYDDYDEDKKFLKILFRPGYGVQARELNQMQTILQKQIQRVGDHLFKDNSMVIPGDIGFDNSTAYVALTDTVGSTQTSAVLSSIVGQTLTGQTSGVTAKVMTYTNKSSSDPYMIYVKYLTANGTAKTFSINETLIADVGGESVVVNSTAGSGRSALGKSSTASIKRGVFYIKKNFVLVEDQTIVLEKFSTTPTTKVCLQVIEDIVSPEEDETLLDNASGSYNYSAPGAHRYAITLNLVKRAYTFDAAEGTDYVELLRLNAGNIEYIVNKTIYNELESTLARRTYDESGNYVIRNFPVSIKEYRNNDRGVYATNRAYLANDIVSYTSTAGVKTLYRALNNGSSDANTVPRTDSAGASSGTVVWQETKKPPYNNGVYTAVNTDSITTHLENESKLAVGLGSGKAYIYGYEVENKSVFYTPVSKARDYDTVQDTLFQPDLGQYVEVTNLKYFPDVSTYPLVYLNDQLTVTPGISSGNVVGTARVRAVKYVSGSGSTAVYRIYLFDINMYIRTGADRYDFTTRAKQLYIPAGTGYIAFTSDVVLQDAVATGTVLTSGKVISGSGTSFLTEFEVGDYVKVNGVYARIDKLGDSNGPNDVRMEVSNVAISGTTSITINGSLSTSINTSTDVINKVAHGFFTGSQVTYDSGLVTSGTLTVTANSLNNTITTSSGHGLIAGDQIRFNSSFSGIVCGKDYYVLADSLTSTVFKITATKGSSTAVTLSANTSTVARSISATDNTITVDSVSGMAVGNIIRFTGGTYLGNVSDGVSYYVKTIDTGTKKITISAAADLLTTYDLQTTTATATASTVTTNKILVSSIAGMAVGNTLVASGTTFGGIATTTYYITSIDTANKLITISTTAGGVSPTLTTATGSMTFTMDTSACSMNINVVSYSSSMTFDKSGVPIGGLTDQGTYYVNSATADTFSLHLTPADSYAGTNKVNITNTTLSTVVIADTAGNFTCASTPLKYGQQVIISGTKGGGGSFVTPTYSDPTTFYIIATNGSTTFQLSATQGGSAIVTTPGTPTGLTYTLNYGTGTSHTFNKNASLGVNLYKSYTSLVNQGIQSLIYPLPEYAIKSVSDVRYRVTRTLDGVVNSNSITVDVTAPYQFDGTDATNYILVDKTTGSVITPNSIAIVEPANNRQLQFDVTSASLPDNRKVLVQSTLFISATTPRTKSLKTGSRIVTVQATGESSYIYTGKSDGLRLVSVLMDTGTWVAPTGTYTIDITDNYTFKDNQTNSYYGISYIQLKSGKAKPSAPITIKFEYLDHAGSGDCFWVNSYSTIPYTDIPSFGAQSLRDCIDFRPTVSDNFTGAVTFADDNALMFKQGTSVELDYSYYLGKKCKVWIDRVGKVNISSGASVKINYPEAPDISEAMLLYKFSVEPYTFSTSATSLPTEAVDNRRYTMSDIGKLEKRINNLEYYTSLSLLESDTNSLSIKDANGKEKFKNGFIVDNFTGHGNGDTTNPDYINSMDFDNRLLRPFYTQAQVDFVEVATTTSQRTARGYALKGDYITLPFTEVAYVTQNTSSTTIKVNPFAFFTFLGVMTITPSNDTWFEVSRRPDLIIEEKQGNYNTIKSMAEKAGVLGTVWGAWTYNWAGKTEQITGGTSYSAGVHYSDIFGGDWRHGQNIASNAFSINTVAVTVPRSRSGVETYVKTVYDDKVVEDKILSSTIIPYMRSRRLTVQVNSLKGGARFYPYFAGKSIGDFCTPAEKIIFTPITSQSSTFDFVSRAGGNYAEAARLVDKEAAELAISVGDVITGYASNGTTLTGTTAVVVGWEKYTAGTNAGKYAVYVVNRKDSDTGTYNRFAVGDIIKGSISGAQGTVVSAETKRQGDNLTASEQGNLHFIFNIPNTDSVKFNTGTNELALLDVSTYNRASSTSSATKGFTASGVFQERQNQVSRTINGEIATKNVSDTTPDVTTETRYSNSPGWYDPLAQTFLIQETSGVFVTGIDLFFAKKDANKPVRVELREVINGFPGKNVLTTSKVSLPASSINISDNASVATRFTFPSPTFLNGTTEYAIVILSDSDVPEVYVATQGQVDNETGGQIEKQPYMGVFFKSQNASTWTADQTTDLKFILYKAKFDTSTTGVVEFENSLIPNQTLDENPIYFTNNSRSVRINQPNHGMNVDSKVKLYALPNSAVGEIYVTKASTTVTGIGTKFNTTDKMYAGAHIYRADGALIGEVASVTNDTTLVLKSGALSSYGISSNTEPYSYANPMNGVSPSEIFKTHDIDSVELDSYVISIGGTATATLESFVISSVTYTKVTVTSGAIISGKMFVGQPLSKISGTATFAAGASVYQINSTTEFIATGTPLDVSGNITFDYGDKPTSTGSAGGNGVKASRDIQYDVINPSINIENYSGTTSSIKFQGITSKSIDGTQTPYVTLSSTGLPLNDYIDIIPGEDHYMPISMGFASNETAVSKSINLSSVSTLRNSGKLLVNMSSTNVNLSPIINVNNVAITAISNKVNSPSNSMNINPIDYITIVPNLTGIKFDGTGLVTITDPGLYDNIKNITSGQYINISDAPNNGDYYVIDTDPDGKWFMVSSNITAKADTDPITIKALNRYYSELTPVGSSSINKYITRKILLANPSNSLRIMFDAQIPPAADVGVYYKLNPTGTNTDFNFVEYRTARANVPTDLKSQSPGLLAHEIDITDLPAFDAVSVKIVMTSTDSTQIPLIKDLRIIATA